MMECITTYTKKAFNPVEAAAADIDITDIAHALSMICRANGHFPIFYSVAQHSINCMNEAAARGYSKEVQLACLLHDASEAYMSDITRPVKAVLADYRSYEERLQNVIFEKWQLSELTDTELAMVSDVDDTILYYEFNTLMDVRLFDKAPELKSKPSFTTEDFAAVEKRFIHCFNRLTRDKDAAVKPLSVGVDWMAGKWIAVELHGDTPSARVFKDISELCKAYEDIDMILIDIPIGLPESADEAKNRPDQYARDYLKVAQRKSSIFNTPFRQMVYTDERSNVWNLRTELGAKITPQSIGIMPAIRQIDMFLQSDPQWKKRLIESHPECAFQALNNGNGLKYSKLDKSGNGQKERMNIIFDHGIDAYTFVEEYKDYKSDDLLDALCLALTAQIGRTSEKGFSTLPPSPVPDSTGLLMQIAIAEV